MEVPLILIYLKTDFLRARPKKDEYKNLLKFSGWIAINRVISSVSGRLDIQMLAVMAGAFATGLYSIPSRLASFIVVLAGSFSSVLAPRLAGFGNKEVEKIYGQVSFGPSSNYRRDSFLDYYCETVYSYPIRDKIPGCGPGFSSTGRCTNPVFVYSTLGFSDYLLDEENGFYRGILIFPDSGNFYFEFFLNSQIRSFRTNNYPGGYKYNSCRLCMGNCY